MLLPTISPPTTLHKPHTSIQYKTHTYTPLLQNITWFQDRSIDRSIYFSWRRRFSPSPALSPVSVLPPMIHIHLHIDATTIIRTSGRNLGTFKQSNALLDIVRVESRTSTCTMSILRGLICGEHHQMPHGWIQDVHNYTASSSDQHLTLRLPD